MKKLDKLPLSSVGSKMYGLEVMENVCEISLFVTFVITGYQVNLVKDVNGVKGVQMVAICQLCHD